MSALWVAWGVAAAAIVAAVVLLAGNRRKDANVRLLLEALENGDTSVRFRRNRSVNRILNRIAEILGAARCQAEQADLYYGVILDKADVGMIVADSRGFVTTCNASALKLLGLTVLTHLSQLGRIDPLLPGAVAAAEPGRRLVVGASLGLTLQVAGLKVNDRELRIYSLADISRELEACEAAAWERLTRTLAHEIMNSLAPVISLSETLLALPPDCESERREGLEAIGATSRGLVRFVEAYRSVAQLPRPELREVDVEAIIRHTAALFPQMRWSVVPAMTVTADEAMLGRVLANLCTNAVQAGAGRITITARPGVIDVANDGAPVSEELAAEIFTPFFTTRHEGSGIGLSLSRRMMTAFGGSLTLVRLADPVTFRLTFAAV